VCQHSTNRETSTGQHAVTGSTAHTSVAKLWKHTHTHTHKKKRSDHTATFLHIFFYIFEKERKKEKPPTRRPFRRIFAAWQFPARASAACPGRPSSSPAVERDKKKKEIGKKKKNDAIVNQQGSMQRGKHASQAKRNKDTPTNQISSQAQPSQEAQWHADSHQGQQASPCTKPGHQAKPRETKTAPKPKKDTMTRQ
jgi:hypothetical protein